MPAIDAVCGGPSRDVRAPLGDRRNVRTSTARRALLAPLLGCVLAALPAGLATGAPTIPNPSFEAGAAFGAAPGTVAANGPIVGWTVTGDDTAQVGLNREGEQNSFADNGIVPHGTRVMFLSSSGNNAAKASTVITGLVAGRHYRVEFRRNRTTGPNPAQYTVQIDGDARRVFNSGNSVDASSGVHVSPYKSSNLIFRATGPTARLDITNQTSAVSTLLVDHFKIVEAVPLQVKNANNDGPGSLRAAIRQADLEGGAVFRVITFAPSLSGQTIPLLSRLDFLGSDGIAIDASSLPKGITLGAVAGASPFSLTQVEDPVHFVGMTFTGGRTDGGAARIFDHAQFTRCTMFGNSNTANGGAIRVSDGVAVLTQCTLSQNNASVGAAIMIEGGSEAFLDHCTVAGNTAGNAGGGVALGSGAKLTIRNSIVSGNNVATGDPAVVGADIRNDSGTVIRLGNNVVDHHVNTGTFTVSGDVIDSAPFLVGLADNGGPTRTMAVNGNSPARNASEGSTISTDQRGLPVVNNEPDIGAFEVQHGRFVMRRVGDTTESSTSALVTVERVDGYEGEVFVNFSTVAGTASTDDFIPQTNRLLRFADATVSFTFRVGVVDDAVTEPNEVFTVVLSAPDGGATLGTPASSTVTIIDTGFDDPAVDKAGPPPPVITSPAAGALLNFEAPFGSITVTGTATDNLGVLSVPVSLTFDDGSFSSIGNAVLDSPGAKSTTWSFTRVFFQPFNTVKIQARTTDGAGASSLFATRTHKMRYPLGVAIAGNGAVSPAGYAPRSFREVGTSHRITAAPGLGALFAGWTVLGALPSEIGLSPNALLRPTITFLHKANLQLVANFVPSPFNNTLSGAYNGLIFVTEGPADNSTEGAISVNVTPTGAFSGNLQIDGAVLPFAGAFDHLGAARFGTSRTTTLRISRPGKPTLLLIMLMDEAGGDLKPLLSGGLMAVDARDDALWQSGFAARRAAFSATIPVPPQLMGSATAASTVFNVILRPLPTDDQPPLFEESFYPQGAGFGRMTLTRTGAVTLSGVALADGSTGITASTFLDSNVEAALFIPLYNRQGYFRCVLDFGHGSVSADVNGEQIAWLRPLISTSHYYSAGWPEIITTSLEGIRHTVVPGRSSLDAIGVDARIELPDLDGNATLQFSQGQLESVLTRRVNVTTADAVTKVPANDPTFTLKIDRATGLISGAFEHTDANLIPFRGILFQKGTLSGGWGYFLTRQPTPIDFSGESGLVRLIGSPVQ